MSRQRILLVDDHEVVRVGLRALLEQHPNFEVVAEAAIARGALDRTGRPLFMLRKLPSDSKKRFFRVASMAEAIEQDFERVAPDSKLLDHSADQAKRMVATFLNLLISDHRIETYLRSIRGD